MSAQSQPIPIDMIGDVASPESFIGLRVMQAVVAQVPGLAVDIRWRPFQADPDLPVEGVDIAAYLDEKGFSAESLRETRAELLDMGGDVGVRFAFDKITRWPNTFAAHRLIRFARDFDVEIAMANVLFEAFFLAGADISDRAVLSTLAAKAGIASEAARAFLESAEGVEALTRELAEVRASGVESAPRFIIAGKETIAGVKSTEDFADALFNSISDE